MSAQTIEPFGGGGCAFAPQDYRNEDDEMLDFQSQTDEAMEHWREAFFASNGRYPNGDEENAHYEALRNPPQKRVFPCPEVLWSDDGECPCPF